MPTAIETGKSPQMVDTATAAGMLGIAAGTLRNYRYMDVNPGPQWVRVGGLIRYPIAEIERYLEQNAGVKCASRKSGDVR